MHIPKRIYLQESWYQKKMIIKKYQLQKKEGKPNKGIYIVTLLEYTVEAKRIIKKILASEYCCK